MELVGARRRRVDGARRLPPVLLLVLAFQVACAGADRPASSTYPGWAAGRPLQLSTQQSQEPAAAVTVDINVTSSQPAFSPKKFGGYRSEETDNWENIYRPDRTLRPLRMPSNRVQLRLQDDELAPNGTFLDPGGTQGGILRAIAASVSADLFVTVGYPWTERSRRIVEGWNSNRPELFEGWESYFNTTYWTLADTLAGRYWTGKPVWVEIFGEPDMALWDWVYGRSRERIFAIAKLAHDAFSRYPGRLRVGGCGFALPEGEWVQDFLAFYSENNMTFSFFSYHLYLGWNDGTDPADYPFPLNGTLPGTGFPAREFNVRWRNDQFLAALGDFGLEQVPIVVSEFAFQDPDLAESAGFGFEPSRSGRLTMTHHHSCARALQAIDIVLSEPSIARAYWAQGVGQIFEPWWDYPDWNASSTENSTLGVAARSRRRTPGALLGAQQTWLTASRRKNHLFAYNPFVIHDQYNGGWRYKGSYWAFWVYGQMAGRRVAAQVGDTRLGVWATQVPSFIRVAIWNRSSAAALPASLSLPGVPAAWPCTLYRVDPSTFKLSSNVELDWVISGPKTITPPRDRRVRTVGAALTQLRRRALRPESTVFLVIKVDRKAGKQSLAAVPKAG